MAILFPSSLSPARLALALAVCCTLPAAANSPDEAALIGQLVRAKSMEGYVPGLEKAMVLRHNGQLYYLAEGQATPLAAGQAGADVPELQVLKFRKSRGGDKIKMKALYNNSVIKTVARTCPPPGEESCSPCTHWQLKFLMSRHKGELMPYNYLFIS